MITTYLKTAWRNLMKHKLVSFINLFGLTVGLACCLLITAYVLHETSYDKYNQHADRVYRITRTFYNTNGSEALRLSTIAPAFGPRIRDYFPEIEKMTRLLPNGRTPVKYGEKMFNENRLFFADENLFDVFTIHALRGNPKEALRDPFSIMITEDIAHKYFGSEDPMNRIIKINNQFDCKVSGVFTSFPSNAHLHPDILVSFNTLKDSTVYGERQLQTSFSNNSFFTYVLLPKNYPAKSMEERFPKFLDERVTLAKNTKTSAATSLALQKLTDIHLRSHTDYEAEENGDIKRVYIFSAIALIILLIACINFMNLSTARSTLRAKEIGIRKVAGATKRQLVFQFLSESVLIVWIAMALACCISLAVMPWLNRMTGLEMSLSPMYTWQWAMIIVVVPVVVGIISGIYPALFLSSFQPVKTLKGLFRTGNRTVSFRQALVVVQFAVSIILIITTAIVFRQLHYMQQTELGYDKEQVIVMPNNTSSTAEYEAFRNAIMKQTGVVDAARSSRIPTGRLLDSQNAAVVQSDSAHNINTEIKYLAVDYDFIPAYHLQLLAGRNFSRDHGTDTAAFLVNETAANIMGWHNKEAVDKEIVYGNTKGRIIGLVKDFHFESLHQKIAPIVFVLPGGPNQNAFFNQLSVKIDGKNTSSTLAHIESEWKRLMPDIPFEYQFLNENFDKQYRSEQRQGNLFTLFSIIAVFIACLGLLGLSAFAISQRIREIGIRKVLGASVNSIVTLLSKDFLKLVGIAALLAFPAAWYMMDKWLSDFAYRIQINWWIFLAAGVVAALVALLTVGLQAVKAAISNPVKSLRTE
jgi:putative ABC transport system permease protein